MTSMRAAIATGYGGPEVLEVREVTAPRLKRGEVLIRVRASTVASADCRIRAARFPPGFGLIARPILGLTKPRQPILGAGLAGVVEQLAAGAQGFRTGEAVIAMTGTRMGAHAEFLAIPTAAAIAPMPRNLSFEEAASLPFGGTTALYFLRDLGQVKPGERVLVNGASGAVGTAAIQLARHFGAHVTAVCSAAKADLVRTLGAAHVIDYRTQDFTRMGETWDVIADVAGTAPYTRSAPVLRDNGRLLLILAGLADLLRAPVQSGRNGKFVHGGVAPERKNDLLLLKDLAEAGALKPVVDSCYPLSSIPVAHARAESPAKLGNVVVTMGADGTAQGS